MARAMPMIRSGGRAAKKTHADSKIRVAAESPKGEESKSKVINADVKTRPRIVKRGK